MAVNNVETYLAARDLGTSPAGNHHFILILLPTKLRLHRMKAEIENGQCFVTIAADDISGSLLFCPNLRNDVQATKEMLCPARVGWSPDFSLERHKISPIGSPWNFALQLERMAYNYERNTANAKISYSLKSCNCASWTNTILKVAGVPKVEREKLTEFSGVDWGEENLLNEQLFR